mmetsp:Transcript_101493/g.302760  ORF Transcript_101493/g.302760 Transcript_101493/m.302760 type:complete len:95 (+) Transcript_101493:311-595(+)
MGGATTAVLRPVGGVYAGAQLDGTQYLTAGSARTPLGMEGVVRPLVDTLLANMGCTEAPRRTGVTERVPTRAVLPTSGVELLCRTMPNGCVGVA